jgi:hypothetical protein
MDTKAVLDNMINMSPQEAEKIKTDQAYQKQIEESLAKVFPPRSMDFALTSKLMEQLKAGKEASLSLEDKVNYDVITSAKPLATMQNLDRWLRSDDTLPDRILNPKTEQDQALKRTFEWLSPMPTIAMDCQPRPPSNSIKFIPENFGKRLCAAHQQTGLCRRQQVRSQTLGRSRGRRQTKSLASAH